MSPFESAVQDAEIVFSTILEDGSLAVPARIIPPPDTISEEARALISRHRDFMLEGEERSLDKLIDHFGDMHATICGESAAMYPVAVRREELGGIACVIVEPEEGISPANRRVVLLNLTGGAGFSGPHNQVEAIPIASLANARVVQPLHRRAPTHPFPADLDDVVAVYRALLEQHESRHIGVYGASSGGSLTFQLVSMLLFLDLPMPGAVAAWGAGGESTRITDSLRVNHDLDNMTRRRPFKKTRVSSVNQIDVKDPVFSPIYANLRLFPPALLSAGTRDTALSSAALMHRALLRAGIAADLVVFEAMEHGFPYYPSLPETQELYRLTARFLRKHLTCEANDRNFRREQTREESSLLAQE